MHMADTEAAQKAHRAVHGRMFAGNTVSVTYISEEEYTAA